MGEGFLGLLLQDPQQAPLLPQPAPVLLVVLEVVPGHIAAAAFEGGQLGGEFGDAVFVVGQIEGGEVAAEAALHQLLRLGQVVALQQVEHHAVAGGELAHQRIGGAGGQGAGLAHPLEAALHRDHIALGIEAAAAGPPRHLQELTAHQGPVAPLGALREGGDHGGAGRHVDAGGQGFGGEHHLDQALLEQFFDQFLPGRQHAGVVGGDPAQQRIGVALPHRLRGGRHEGIEPGADARLLAGIHQAHLAQVAHRLIAAAAAEDEIDGRQHLTLRHLGHHEADRWCLRLGRAGFFGPLAAGGLGRPPDLAIRMEAGAFVVEQGVEALGAAKAEGQWHRPVIAEHQPGGAMHPLDPVGELPGVGHRGREGHQLHRRRAVDDRFLPDGAALGVVHVMALIEHHRLHVMEGVVGLAIDLRIEHVAEDLGGHHHDAGLAVEAQVAGEQAHVLGAELVAEIAQLLIGEGLERRCVEHLAPMGQGPVNGVLAHQGLAGAGGGAHHHRMADVQGIDRLQLEGIEREGEELAQGRHGAGGGALGHGLILWGGRAGRFAIGDDPELAGGFLAAR